MTIWSKFNSMTSKNLSLVHMLFAAPWPKWWDISPHRVFVVVRFDWIFIRFNAQAGLRLHNLREPGMTFPMFENRHEFSVMKLLCSWCNLWSKTFQRYIALWLYIECVSYEETSICLWDIYGESDVDVRLAFDSNIAGMKWSLYCQPQSRFTGTCKQIQVFGHLVATWLL